MTAVLMPVMVVWSVTIITLIALARTTRQSSQTPDEHESSLLAEIPSADEPLQKEEPCPTL